MRDLQDCLPEALRMAMGILPPNTGTILIVWDAAAQAKDDQSGEAIMGCNVPQEHIPNMLTNLEQLIARIRAKQYERLAE